LNDPAAFIQANTELLKPPLVPEIVLHLASEIVPIWRKTEEELALEGVPPPFWAFAWAGGQALARWVLDHPECVRGKRVLDFASGSGLSAIAAIKAGASEVIANEIDRFAIAAITLNAKVNDVRLQCVLDDLIGRDDGWDIVIAGDVCYEREMSERVFIWLTALASRGATVLMGDPGRNYLPKADLHELAVYDVQTTRELEDREVRRTRVWRVGKG
jgi:predicted nicotinamide N-methyase